MATPRIITAPAYWASALVNDDRSGLTHGETLALYAWLEQEEFPNVVDVYRDDDGTLQEPRFTWSYGLYAGPLCTCQGGEVLDYVVLDD